MNDCDSARWARRVPDLFSDEWFAHVAGLAAAIDLPDVDLTVEYVCSDWPGELVHHQLFAGGRLRTWGRGPTEAPDVRLRQTLTAHTATLTGKGLGNAVLNGTEVLTSAGSTPPPPLDEVVVPWGAELPIVPTAPDLVVQQILTGSPFGTVSVVFDVRQGRVAGGRLGTTDDADVSVVRPFADAMAERAGELDVLDSIRHGEVGGDYLAVSMFLGIYESDECREARRALTTPAVGALVRLGTLLSSDCWRSLGRELADAADEMRSVP